MEDIYFICTWLLLPFAFVSSAERCILQNQMCDMHGENLIWSQAEVTDLECKQMCMDTRDCNVFTHFGSGSFPFHNFCMLFSSCETFDGCQDCLTAIVSGNCTCGLSYEGSIDADNIIQIEEDVEREEDCRHLCYLNSQCTVYTYYDPNHAVHAKLCLLLTAIHDPVQRCQNCQTGSDRCEALVECKLGVWDDDGTDLSLTKFFASEDTRVRYVSGETGCFKTASAVAVGTGGRGGKCSDNGGGGGSGFINSSEVLIQANRIMVVDLNENESSLTIYDTGDVVLTAANGMFATDHCYNGGDGYSGGGGAGISSGGGAAGGANGQDGENGHGTMYGGKGSGVDVRSISMTYYKLSPGNAGRTVDDFGGGAGGVLVDGVGPENGDFVGVGEGYGGGGNGDDSFGSSGFVILEV